MFSVDSRQQPPWHGLGAVLDEYPKSIDEALEKAVLGWKVSHGDVLVVTTPEWTDDFGAKHPPALIPAKGFKANIREDIGEVLGIVSVFFCLQTTASASARPIDVRVHSVLLLVVSRIRELSPATTASVADRSSGAGGSRDRAVADSVVRGPGGAKPKAIVGAAPPEQWFPRGGPDGPTGSGLRCQLASWCLRTLPSALRGKLLMKWTRRGRLNGARCSAANASSGSAVR